MAEAPCRVLVYGTLMTGAWNHQAFCADALSVEPATARGTLYLLPAGFSAVVEGEGTVHGEAMTFPDFATKLVELDRLEGYRPGCPERTLYVRRVVEVCLVRSGRIVPAWCYAWRGELPRGARVMASGRWEPAQPGRTGRPEI